MGQIVGEVFDKYVRDQIEVRQQKLGQLQHDTDFHLWATNRKPWIRLCSSVDISEGKRKELGLSEEFKGELLAQNYILYGGVTNIKSELKAGLMPNLDSTYLNTPNAYGFNSSPEFGFSPMPSVSSIQITPKNRGSLVEAKIKIQCHNVDQFNIIETLYLRLKYTILLEWGHSVYYNNEGTLITSPTDTIYKKFLQNKRGRYKRLNEIEQERKNSCGNYDGFMGWVSNFSWSFNEHGGYDIELTAISFGDIIESLKTSQSIPSGKKSPENKEASALPGAKTILGSILYGFKDKLNNQYAKHIDGKDIKATTINTDFELGIEKVTNSKEFSNKELFHLKEINIQAEEYYLKLGTLLRIIQNLIYIQDGDGDSISNFDFGYDDNYCFNPGNNLLSLNPQVVLIPSKFQSEFFPWERLGMDTSFLYKNDLGRIMHAYLNIDFVLDSFNKNISTEDNTLAVQDFISSILTGINNACGNVTDLNLSFNPYTNTYFILDNNIPPSKAKPSKFNIIKLKAGNDGKETGSFIKKTSITSQLSPQFATQIAIGAQAAGTSTDNTTLAFSNWNRGLTDRIVPSRIITEASPETDSSLNKFKTEFQTDLNFFYFQFGLEESKPYYEQIIKKSSAKKVFSSFIPISLTIEMEGLSGMKIYQKYSIIDKYLPKNYRNNIEFITKGINHSVNEKEWNTTVEGLSIPKT